MQNKGDCVTLSWRRPLSYRKQSIDLRSKSVDWFLYDNGLRHERVNVFDVVKFYFVFSAVSTDATVIIKD